MAKRKAQTSKKPTRKQTAAPKENTFRELPRIRSFKPELFVHLGLFDAEQKYRLPLWQAFAGLILCADREGRFRWQPRRLKLYTIPYHEVDMEDVMNALAKEGFIEKYPYQGQWYGVIPGFLKHQKITTPEPPSLFPSIEDARLEAKKAAPTLKTDPKNGAQEDLISPHPSISLSEKTPPNVSYQSENKKIFASKSALPQDEVQKKCDHETQSDGCFLDPIHQNFNETNEARNENDQNLILTNPVESKIFQKREPSFSENDQHNSSTERDLEPPTPEKINKNNEIEEHCEFSTDLEKSFHFEEKNLILKNAQGKERIGKEGKGMERIGRDGKGKGTDREGNANGVALDARSRVRVDSLSFIFEHWKTVMKHPNARLDPNRKKLITKALKLGYGMDELCQAISGCGLTPYNMGDNERGQVFDGLHVILRDADQIDRFMRNYQAPPRRLTEADRRMASNAQVLQAWMEEQWEGEAACAAQR